MPQRLSETEAAAIGQPISAKLVEDIVAAAGQVETMSDAYVSAEYRSHLAGVMTRRAITTAIARLGVKAHV